MKNIERVKIILQKIIMSPVYTPIAFILIPQLFIMILSSPIFTGDWVGLGTAFITSPASRGGVLASPIFGILLVLAAIPVFGVFASFNSFFDITLRISSNWTFGEFGYWVFGLCYLIITAAAILDRLPVLRIVEFRSWFYLLILHFYGMSVYGLSAFATSFSGYVEYNFLIGATIFSILYGMMLAGIYAGGYNLLCHLMGRSKLLFADVCLAAVVLALVGIIYSFIFVSFNAS